MPKKLKSSPTPTRRSQRLSKKNFVTEENSSGKLEPKIPKKAISFVCILFGVVGYLIRIFYKSPTAQQISQISVQLKTWHYFPQVTMIYRTTCLAVIISQIISFYVYKKDVVRMVIGLDMLPRKVTAEQDWNVFYAFTTWCWTLEGICMAMLLLLQFELLTASWFVVATQLAFELSVSFAMLVTTVVTFVIIPGGIKAKHDMTEIFSVRTLLMHNANLLFMVVELLLCHVKFNIIHVLFAPIFGLIYVCFSWYVANRRGYFLYWFINYNFKYVLVSYIILMVVLIAFFGTAALISHFIDPIEHPWSIPLVILGALQLCRFKK